MRIIYIGNVSGTSLQRIDAFRRLGCKLQIIDPEHLAVLPKSLLYKWLFETGGFLLVFLLNIRIYLKVKNLDADLIWVNGGDLISPWLLKKLKKRFFKIVNYNNDLPFGKRDKLRWKQYYSSVPFYDLMLVRSNTELEKPLALNAKKVVAMYMLADEVIHNRQKMTEVEVKFWSSEVLFIGTWFPERGSFFKELIEYGVPLTIYGDRWHKAPEWEVIKPFWKGSGLSGLDYTYALQCSKICLGLVSEENNDLHTRRSMEAPSLGVLLCAKRTYEHELMYKEGVEAVFWDDAIECAALCKELLKNHKKIAEISSNGNDRFNENGFTNEKFLSSVLKSLKIES